MTILARILLGTDSSVMQCCSRWLLPCLVSWWWLPLSSQRLVFKFCVLQKLRLARCRLPTLWLVIVSWQPQRRALQSRPRACSNHPASTFFKAIWEGREVLLFVWVPVVSAHVFHINRQKKKKKKNPGKVNKPSLQLNLPPEKVKWRGGPELLPHLPPSPPPGPAL